MKEQFISMKTTTNPAKFFTNTPDELKVYIRKINSFKSLTADEEKEIAKRAKSGDREAKRILVQANLKLVLTIARKAIHVSKLPLVDLIQEGNLGLITAAGKFNPKFNCRFSTYAFPWITQYILRYIQNKMPVIRLPHKKEEKIRQIKKSKAYLTDVLGREPSTKEIALYLDMGESELKKILECDYSCISMHTPIEGMDGVTGEDMLADERYSLENTSMKVFVQNEIQSLLHTLSERERQVLYYRYDMGDSKNNPRTFRQISKILGCSAETVRKIELHALKSLRSVAKEKLSI